MRFSLLVLTALFSVAVTASGDRRIRVAEEVEYVLPANSPVSYQAVGEFGVVHYSGQFALAGQFTYGYTTDNPEADVSYGELFLSFTISPENAKRLPYWTRDGAIREIEIRNPERFATQLIGKTDLALLRAKQIRHVSGNATIVVRDLQTSVECDVQHTSVEFVSLNKLLDHRVAKKLAEDSSGC